MRARDPARAALTLDDAAGDPRRRRRAEPRGRRRATAIRASAAVVQRAAAGDAPVYGVNTGFGKLASQRIDADELATLQLNLIRSHSGRRRRAAGAARWCG